jgi:CheY-like chemotaxis protein
LEFELESREAGQLSKLIVSVFGLKRLKGDIEISSLKDARWTMQHEYVQAVGYPLWSLKYATDDEELKKVISDVVEVVNEAESVKKPQLMASAVSGLSQRRTDLGNLLLQQTDGFRKGFNSYILSLDRIALTQDELEKAYNYLKEHLAGTNSFWSEKQVEDALRDMREEGTALDKVHLIITDIEMPQMDGHRLCKLIKEDDTLRKIPVIIFSSLINDDIRKKGEAVGADDQLTKPEIGKLVGAVDRLVAQYEQYRQDEK